MDAWIQPGTHITAVGADAPGKQEIEGSLLARARIIVDKKEQAFHSGEVNVPLAMGVLKPEGIAGELGDVVRGKLPGRTSPEEITLFDSTGLAVQDVAVGAWVYLKAKERNVGVRLVL
jgi:alanine dehydrogenase